MLSQFTRLSILFLVVVFFVPEKFLSGAENPKIVARCKNATALVDLGALGSGSAFCIDPTGIFLTNHHVVVSKGMGGVVKLVLSPGEKQERAISTRVVAWSEENDIAVLLAQDTKGLVALPIASSGKVNEVDSVTAYGFPFGKRLSSKAGIYPSISINTGKVTALRKRENELRAIQIDAGVNPGNSEGPLVNQKGEVVGIIVSGNPTARIAFAVPSDFASELVRRPALLWNLPEIPFAARYEVRTFEIEILQLKGDSIPGTIELEIGNDRDAPRSFQENVVNNKARFEVSAIHPDGAPLKLNLTSRFGGVNRTLDTVDSPIRIGNDKLQLAEIRKIERRTNDQIVTCNSGRKIAGHVTGMEEMSWNDGTRVKVDAEDCIDVCGRNVGPLEIHVECTVSHQGEVVSSLRQSISLANPPAPLLDNPNDPSDAYSPYLDELLIDARIGGIDDLIVRPTGLYWHHKRWEKPGEPEGTKAWVSVNQRRWELNWNRSGQTNQDEDVTELFPLKLGFELWDFELVSIKADPNSPHDGNRGKITTHQDPLFYRVEFDDVAANTSLYRFRLKKKYQRKAPRLASSTSGRSDTSPSVDLQVSTGIDMLSAVKLPDHVLDGRCERIGDVLVCDSVEDSRVLFPFVLRGGYDLRFEFERESAKGQLIFMLPAGSESCTFVIDWDNSRMGLQLVDGREIKDRVSEVGAVAQPPEIVSGRKYQIEFHIQESANDNLAITAKVDGHQSTSWTGRASQLRIPPALALPVIQAFGVRNSRSTLRIHACEMKTAPDARGSRLGGDWKNSVTPVAETPPPQIEAKCLTWNGKKYFISEDQLTFVESQRLAMQLQGRLVTVSTPEEEAFLTVTARFPYFWTAGWRRSDGTIWRDERNRRITFLPRWAAGNPDMRPGESHLAFGPYNAPSNHNYAIHDVFPADTLSYACIEWGEEYPLSP